MRKRILAATFGAGLLALTWTGEANAQQLRGFSWEHVTLNGGPRFGSDDLNFGAGLNVGYTLDMGLYLGGLFDYFLGESEEFGPYEYGFDAWFLLFDIGYDFGFGDQFVLRPTGSLGMVTAHGRLCIDDDCDTETDSEFAFALGANAIYNLDGLTLGGELRFFSGDDFDGVWMGFNIGTVF